MNSIQSTLDKLEELGLDSVEFESSPSSFISSNRKEIEQGLTLVAKLEENKEALIRLGVSKQEWENDIQQIKDSLYRLTQERQALEIASRALSFFDHWAQCYAACAKFKALCAAQVAGHNKRKEIEKKVKLLDKLSLDEYRSCDPFFLFQLEQAAIALKEVGCVAGDLRGASSGFSAVGAARSDWGRVVHNATGSAWLNPMSAKAQAATKAGSLPALPHDCEAEAVERLEAMGEKVKAPKVRIKHNKLAL